MIEAPQKTRYPAAEARSVAELIVTALRPLCERIEIAGSLRRGKPTVGDIEILYVPKMDARPDGLFGTKQVSLADEQIEDALARGVIVKRPSKVGIFTWGDKNKLAIHVASGIPVDFFATSLECWWVALVVRTGSAETNLSLTTAAQRQGKSLLAYGEGVRQPDGTVIAATTERMVFDLCGVAYREPWKR